MENNSNNNKEERRKKFCDKYDRFFDRAFDIFMLYTIFHPSHDDNTDFHDEMY